MSGPESLHKGLANQFIRLLTGGLFYASTLISNGNQTPPPGYQPLFNGQNLNGFYTWLVDTKYKDPRQVFTASKGVLRISGEGLGYLGTRRTFHEYDLILDYRWGRKNWPWGDRIGKARDSGLFLHATGEDGNSVDGKGAFMAAIECNIFQGATGDFLLIRGKTPTGTLISPELQANVRAQKDSDGWFTWTPDGVPTTIKSVGRINWFNKSKHWKDTIDFRGNQDIARAPGEWNTIECRCRQDSITIKLNGIVVNRVTPIFPRSGKILLQCEGSEIFFRRIGIRPISPAP